jgi:small-conductance mechanosensitive channel
MNVLNDLLGVKSTFLRILVILFLALGSHISVILVRRAGRYILSFFSSKPRQKLWSVSSLSESFLIFFLYFGAFGLILRELGVSLKAYLASASVIGLAVGFGSQGLVQDVVTGLTLVLSNLIDVGDMVEIGGQTGIVRSISMRFTVLENALGAVVFIPNRSITNVINYPRGYVRCLVDIMMTERIDNDEELKKTIEETMSSFAEQFPGLLIRPPGIEGLMKTVTGKKFLRIKFRIWPGRGSAIEVSFKEELMQRLKMIDPAYTDWMVTVSYEVEKTIKNPR